MDGSISAGEHTPTVFAALLLERVGARASGVLTVQHDAQLRSVSLVGGAPVAVLTSVPEEALAATLVSAGRVDAARMAWMEKHCGPDEPLVEGLIAAGSLSQEDLDTHTGAHLFSLIGASLGWSSGEWRWSDAGPSAVRRFDPSLLPVIDPLEALIHGVRQAFEPGALRTFVQESDAGPFILDSRLTGGRAPTWLPAELRVLPERLASGEEFQATAESLGVEMDRIAAILWLLEATQLVHRRNPPAALVPVSMAATIVSSGTFVQKKKAKKPKKLRSKRAQRAAAAEPVVAAQPAPAVERAAPPPKPHKKKSKKQVPKPTLERAQALLDSEDYGAAYAMLTELRNAHPSCPDTLAALGWAGWRTGNHGTNAYDSPDDFLLLALTFDPAHPRALEYFARMAMDQGDVETARNRLLQLLQVDPDSAWARAALEDGDLATNSKKSGLGLRFWPKR